MTLPDPSPPDGPVPEPLAQNVAAFIERCAELRNGSPNAFYAHVDAFCKAAAAPSSPAPAEPTQDAVTQFCIWKEESGGEYWESDCGETWTFLDGTPAENHARFCHGCGKVIQAITFMEQIDADDVPASPSQPTETPK